MKDDPLGSFFILGFFALNTPVPGPSTHHTTSLSPKQKKRGLALISTLLHNTHPNNKNKTP
jgi:hypothetical protein